MQQIMKKKRLLMIVLIMALLPFTSVCVNAENPGDIDLEAGYTDPDHNQNEDPRSPILIPHVGIDGYTLTFYTPCNGSTLRLIDENNTVVYAIVIPVGASTLVLPSYLSGNYRIEIIPGAIYFWGHIEI